MAGRAFLFSRLASTRASTYPPCVSTLAHCWPRRRLLLTADGIGKDGDRADAREAAAVRERVELTLQKMALVGAAHTPASFALMLGALNRHDALRAFAVERFAVALETQVPRPAPKSNRQQHGGRPGV